MQCKRASPYEPQYLRIYERARANDSKNQWLVRIVYGYIVTKYQIKHKLFTHVASNAVRNDGGHRTPIIHANEYESLMQDPRNLCICSLLAIVNVNRWNEFMNHNNNNNNEPRGAWVRATYEMHRSEYIYVLFLLCSFFFFFFHLSVSGQPLVCWCWTGETAWRNMRRNTK